MSLPEPIEQLKDNPLRFLESDQFQEMLQTYRRLKPLASLPPFNANWTNTTLKKFILLLTNT